MNDDYYRFARSLEKLVKLKHSYKPSFDCRGKKRSKSLESI